MLLLSCVYYVQDTSQCTGEWYLQLTGGYNMHYIDDMNKPLDLTIARTAQVHFLTVSYCTDTCADLSAALA